MQLEMAVERNPSHPDFTGLEECMGGAVTASGAASVVSFREWVAGRQKDRATVLKQARLEREERALIGPAEGTPKRRPHPKGDPKKKAKDKNGKGGAGGAAGEG